MYKIFAIIFFCTLFGLHANSPEPQEEKTPEECVLDIDQESMPTKKRVQKRRARKRHKEATSQNNSSDNQEEEEQKTH